MRKINTPSEFRWRGSALGGLFSGEHFWLFQPSAVTPEATTFVHGEDHSGPLARLFEPGYPLHGPVTGVYDSYSQDLKKRVESLQGRDGAT